METIVNSFRGYEEENEEEEGGNTPDDDNSNSDVIAYILMILGILLFLHISYTSWMINVYVYYIIMSFVILSPFYTFYYRYVEQNDSDEEEPKKKRKKKKRKRKKRVLPIVQIKETDLFDRRESLHRTRRKFDLVVARIRVWGSICITLVVLVYIPFVNRFIPQIVQRLIFIGVLVIVLMLFIEFVTTRQYRRVRKPREMSHAQKEKAALLGFSTEEMTFDEDKRRVTPSRYGVFGDVAPPGDEDYHIGSGQKRTSDPDSVPFPTLPSTRPQTYHDYWAEKYRQSSHRRKKRFEEDDEADDEEDVDLGDQGFGGDTRSGLDGLLLTEDEDPYDFISHGSKREDTSKGGSIFRSSGRKSSHRSASRSKSSHHATSTDVGPGQDHYSPFDLLLQDQIPLGSGYMREIEDVNELEHLTSRMNEFSGVYNRGSESGRPSTSSRYHMSSRRSNERFSSTTNTQQRNYRKAYLPRDTSSEDKERPDRNEHLKTLSKFGISPFMMSIWMKNMRGWISRKIIQPINHYVVQNDKKFRDNNLKNYDCSHNLSSPPGPYHTIPTGLRKSERVAADLRRNPLTLRYILQYLQRDRSLASIIMDRRRLELYLKLTFCYATRPYLVRRLKELAMSYGAFVWDGSSSKNWSRALATDSELMMQFFVNFCNFIIPSSDKLMGKTMFSQSHFVDRTRGGDDNKHISKNGLYISLEKRDPPHFAVIWEGRVLKTERGKNNVFFSLCLFAYILKTKFDCNMGRAPGSKKFVGPGSQYNIMECLS